MGRGGAGGESDAVAVTDDELSQRVVAFMQRRESRLLGGGIAVEAVRAGYAKLSLKLTEDMLNGHGTGHGGVIFTLADVAFSYACNSRNEATVAQQASIAFLTPARAGETLTAKAVEQAREGRSGVYTVTIRGADNRVVAIFQGLSRSIGGKVVEA
jgi:acyl-CoA thioesterase